MESLELDPPPPVFQAARSAPTGAEAPKESKSLMLPVFLTA